MQVLKGIGQLKKFDKAVITTGTFDGVHLGHRVIIDRVIQLAKSIDGTSIIVTFHPHPRTVVQPDDKNLRLLSSLDEKIKLLENTGIDVLAIIDFTKEFSQTNARTYVQNLLIEKLGMNKLVIGYDHQFGKNREGSLSALQQLAPELNFEVEEIPAIEINNVNISSTKIRNALLIGDVATANKYLGYPYTLQGTVIKGDQIGRLLGYPTANVKVDEPLKLIPADGVYAAIVGLEDGRKFGGMLYIGNRSTFAGMDKRVEINLFDFNEELYDTLLEISFIEYIRGDMHFNSKEDLIFQIKKDKKSVQKILNLHT